MHGNGRGVDGMAAIVGLPVILDQAAIDGAGEWTSPGEAAEVLGVLEAEPRLIDSGGVRGHPGEPRRGSCGLASAGAWCARGTAATCVATRCAECLARRASVRAMLQAVSPLWAAAATRVRSPVLVEEGSVGSGEGWRRRAREGTDDTDSSPVPRGTTVAEGPDGPSLRVTRWDSGERATTTMRTTVLSRDEVDAAIGDRVRRPAGDRLSAWTRGHGHKCHTQPCSGHFGGRGPRQPERHVLSYLRGSHEHVGDHGR